MITTPEETKDLRPDGLNILDTLFRDIEMLKKVVVSLSEENKALREAIEERLNNLTLNIPDTTLHAIIARTLHMHAQVLMAATSPQTQTQQQVEEQAVEAPTEEATPAT